MTEEQKNISANLSKSCENNTVADFYNNIMNYYPNIEKYSAENWKKRHTVMSFCISFENIFSYLIDPSFGIGLPHITFELCEKAKVLKEKAKVKVLKEKEKEKALKKKEKELKEKAKALTRLLSPR